MSSSFAPGKVVLLGEHAVVYGRPALAAAIDRGARARVRAGASERPSLSVHFDERVREDASRAALRRAYGSLLRASGATSLDAALDVELPPGGGLGSSAAMGVALARAIDPCADDDEIFARAMRWEATFHGRPSGVDVAASMSGGCIEFTVGEPVAKIDVGVPLLLCVGRTGVASSTKVMVRAVASRRAQAPRRVDRVFDDTAALVGRAREAIERGDRATLGDAMNEAQALLVELGVSSPELDRTCDLALGAGALGAKLTGAGGGGCVIALVADTGGARAVLEAWRRTDTSGFVTTIGGSGPVAVRPAHAAAAALGSA